MRCTALLLFCSLLVSVLLTPQVRRFALWRGWVDKPDNDRKVHKVPVPRIGGVPLIVAYWGALGILILINRIQPIAAYSHLSVAWSLLWPAGLVFCVGLLDDIFTLRPWHKISAEGLAALIAYFGGIQIHEILGYALPDYIGLPLTVGWLVGCTNAFNLIDGLDGLAAGVGLVATLSTLGAGFVHNDAGLLTATAPLAGALLGFLIFNYNPASIFLGDGGSLWVGFMLACLGVFWSEKSVTMMSISAPMMALSIPLLDTGLSIVRRFLRRQPIFTADRGHIHHRLVDRGLSPRRAVLLLYAAGGIGASFALLESAGNPILRLFLLLAFALLVWSGIHYLGYREFALAANLLRQNTLRSMLQSNYSLQAYADSLTAARTADECWCTIRAVAKEFGFTYAELKLAGHKYEQAITTAVDTQWLLQIPISRTEYVSFRYQFEGSAVLPISSLADLLHRSLVLKASTLEKTFSLEQSTSPAVSIDLTSSGMHDVPVEAAASATAS